MINDVIDIKDAKVINVGFDYEIVSSSRYNNNQVLSLVHSRLQSYLGEKRYIGEPIYITEIYSLINKTPGVVDTIKVTPKILNDSSYSQMSILINDILSVFNQ